MWAEYMEDNTDVQELHGGLVTDMRMEMLLKCFVNEEWKAVDLSQLFNEVVREFISDKAPLLRLDHMIPYDASAMLYLQVLDLDFVCIFENSGDWIGPYDYLPDAHVAISVGHFGDGEDFTDFTPGRHLNQAALCAVVQLAREKSSVLYNQGQLPLN